VMHRLVAGADVARIHPRGHRLDALPLPWQTQPDEVGAQRLSPICVAEGGRHPLDVLPKPPFAGIWCLSHVWMLAWYPWKALHFLTQ
jgi:hypothetical protein